jgi:hypothetical protein
MECINLQEQFGTRYRVTFDAAYSPKHVPRDKLDPWTMQVPCERGTVYPHGGDLLAVEVEGRRVTANRLRQLDCTTTYQATTTAAGFGCGTAETGIDWLPADGTVSASIWPCKTFGGIGVSVRSSEPAGVAWRVGWHLWTVQGNPRPWRRMASARGHRNANRHGWGGVLESRGYGRELSGWNDLRLWVHECGGRP